MNITISRRKCIFELVKELCELCAHQKMTKAVRAVAHKRLLPETPSPSPSCEKETVSSRQMFREQNL